MKNSYKLICVLIIVANIFWLPFSIYLLLMNFGRMGFGIIVFPISLIINLLLIPAFHDLRVEECRYEVINTVGLLFTIIVSFFVCG